MKLTTKILFTFSLAVMLLLIGTIVYFRTNAEVTPAPLIKETVKKTIDLTGVSNLKFGRGLWIVDLKQSDSNYAKIEGADNLINNFSVIKTVDDTLIVDVDEKFEYDNTWQNYIEIKLNRIQTINLSRNTHITCNSFSGDSLLLEIDGFSSLKMINNNYDSVVLEGSGEASALFEECRINDLRFTLKNMSVTAVRNSIVNGSGTCFNNASYFQSTDKSEKLIVSDSVRAVIENTKEFLPGIKFYDTPQSLLSRIKGRYILQNKSEPVKRNDTLDVPHIYRYLAIYELTITYFDAEIFEIPVNSMHFIFSNGMLTSFQFSKNLSGGDTASVFQKTLDSLSFYLGDSKDCPPTSPVDYNKNCVEWNSDNIFGGLTLSKSNYLFCYIFKGFQSFLLSNVDYDARAKRISYIKWLSWKYAKNEIFKEMMKDNHFLFGL